jgi:hypothetical protein
MARTTLNAIIFTRKRNPTPLRTREAASGMSFAVVLQKREKTITVIVTEQCQLSTFPACCQWTVAPSMPPELGLLVHLQTSFCATERKFVI